MASFHALLLCTLVLVPTSCATREALGERPPADSPDDEGSPAGEDGWYLDDGSAAQSSDKVSEARVEAVRPDSAAPVRASEPDAPTPAGERQVVYSAALRLVVVSLRETLAAIQDLARETGGYLQESDARSITIRVPATAFESTVAKIAGLGEVVEKSVRAADVTEQMLDLGARLENARKARERLVELLAKSDKIEDTLKIEQELARVTTEIEELEGKQRYMQAQIAMSTIRVELNTSARRPGDADTLGLPFAWLSRLGEGLVAGTVQARPRKPWIFSAGPTFTPPAGFVRYYSDSSLVEALSADGLRLKVAVQDNFDEAAVAFWAQLARQSLVKSRSLAVADERDLGDERALLGGTREVAGEPYGYLLVIERTKRRVYLFEAWGPKDAFDREVAALIESAKSLRR